MMDYNKLTYTLLFLSLAVLSWSCDEEDDEVDCQESGLSVTTLEVTEADCITGGQVTVEAEGGKTPYSYSIDGLTFSSDPTITEISAGSYQVTVQDANGCITAADFSVASDENAVQITSLVQTIDSGCGDGLGQLEINTSGGTGNLEYSTDGLNFSSSSTLEGLSQGALTVTVRDEEGCEDSSEIQLISGVSYSSVIGNQSESIADIISMNCAVSDCHVSGTNLTDFSDFEEIQDNAGGIKVRTQSGSMPPNDLSITQEQIDLIACWVDDGARDN